MSAHNSAYKVIIPFGKYKNMSLGYIHDINPSYLDWLVAATGIPENWKTMAAKVLMKEPLNIDHIKLKKNNVIIEHIEKNKLKVKFDYDRNLLERFKLEVDGRKWNDDEKYWEIPSEQIIRAIKVFGGLSNVSLDEKSKILYDEEVKRRQDLDVIRAKENDSEYAKYFYNTIQIGKILNWNEINTNPRIKQFIRE